jgi:hypothetical protein
MVCFHIQFHIHTSIVFIMYRLQIKDKETFHTAAIFLFYVLQKDIALINVAYSSKISIHHLKNLT